MKLSSQHEVIGPTTASTVWLAVAVGTASGLGNYALAASGATLTIVFLVALRPLEDRVGSKATNRGLKTETTTTDDVDQSKS